MERLSHVEVPQNPAKYSAKGFFSRKRFHVNKSQHEWILILVAFSCGGPSLGGVVGVLCILTCLRMCVWLA